MFNSSLLQASLLNKTITAATTTDVSTVLNENSNLTFQTEPNISTNYNNNNNNNNNNEFENDKRRDEYYKSNPLRNYAPTRGQKIIPLSTTNSSPSKIKRLPSAYKDLRSISNNSRDDNQSIYSIRSNSNKSEIITAHKYKLKTDLKISLNYSDDKKNLIDIRESTKKLYNEYCHKNITKPIILKNVKPSSSSNTTVNNISNNNNNTNTTITTNNNSTILNHTNNPYVLSADSINIDAVTIANTHNNNNNNTATITTNNNNTNNNNNNDPKTPFIDIKRVHINTLEEMIDEIKNKNKLKNPNKIIYDNYDNQNVKYKYKEHHIKLGEYIDSNQNNFIITNGQTDSFLNHVNYDFDEIELLPPPVTANNNNVNSRGMGNVYKRINKKSPNIDNNDQIEQEIDLLKQQYQQLKSSQTTRAKYNPNSANTVQYFQSKCSVLSHVAPSTTDLILKPDEYDQYEAFNRKDSFYIDRPMTRNSKQRKRAQQAREKIQSQSEKENLNKRTFIQPFEDTKVVINLDQIPIKALNTFFYCNNEQTPQPSYLIPPVKPYGYFTTKALDNYLTQPIEQPPPVKKKSSKKNNNKNNDETNKNELKDNKSVSSKKIKDNDSSTVTYITPRFIPSKKYNPKLVKSNSSANVIYSITSN